MEWIDGFDQWLIILLITFLLSILEEREATKLANKIRIQAKRSYALKPLLTNKLQIKTSLPSYHEVLNHV